MHLRSWTFRVQADTCNGEVVGVTGDVPQLGEWKVSAHNTVVILSKDSSDSESGMWTGTTWLPQSVDVHYRYYISVVVDDKVIIKHREVSHMPRRIEKDVPSNTDFQKTWDVFGVTNGPTTHIDRGWLTSETVVQFKLFSSPITFWKEKLNRRKTLLKLTPVSVAKRDDSTDVGEMLENSLSLDTHDDASNDSDVWPITEVAELSDPDAALEPQQQFGRELGKDDFLLFQVQTHKPDEIAYLLDFYMPNPRADEGEVPDHVGFAYILPSVIKGSEGHLVVPITSTRHRPLGQLSLYYLVILPIREFDCDMSVSYSRYWKHSSLGLDVAHRGLGTTNFKQKSCAEVRENTIASLKEAASHGADFVEFDVQLSKDMVPVIYHDFHVCISLKRKRVNEGDMLEFPIKELTLNQLQSLKDINPMYPSRILYYRSKDSEPLLYHIEEGKEKQQLLFDDELEEHQPFPTLEHAFVVIDPALGFNIEIKWTMMLKDGTLELDNPFDLNTYLDAVLKVVLEHGGNRKIVFSCFHPDICTMVKYKQAKYPVVFLTQGITSKYPMYHDARCHTIPSAVNFARCLGMLGINIHSEEIMRDPGTVAFVKNHGLVLFCWGDDNNDPKNIEYLKKLGLNAIIYDKIDQFGPKRRMLDTVYLSERSEHQQELLQMLSTDGSTPAAPTSPVPQHSSWANFVSN